MKSVKHNASPFQKAREAKRGTQGIPKMFGINVLVMTDDGPGKVAGYDQRSRCRQYVVRLDDGRVRHYAQVQRAGT